MAKRGVGRLGEIALAQGEAFVGGGNRPIRLADPELVWYVVAGAVDVFVAQRSGDEAASDFKQLLRAGPGRLIFGVAKEDNLSSSEYIAKGLPDTELRRVPRSPHPRLPNCWPSKSISGPPTSRPRSPAKRSRARTTTGAASDASTGARCAAGLAW